MGATTEVEQLFLEAKDFLLKRSAIFTSRNLDDLEYVAHYMAKFAEWALASHVPSEAAAQPDGYCSIAPTFPHPQNKDCISWTPEIEHNDH